MALAAMLMAPPLVAPLGGAESGGQDLLGLETDKGAEQARLLSTAREHAVLGRAALVRFNADRTANANAIVDAAVSFGRARRLMEGMDVPDVVEIQASLYWCRKQMDVEAVKGYIAQRGEEAELGIKAAETVAAMQVPASEGAAYLERAVTWVKAHPQETFQAAVLYLEVAERFQGTPSGTEASKRALAIQQQLMKTVADARSSARATMFSRPVAIETGKRVALPAAAAQREALALVKKTYAAYYPKRDAKTKGQLVRRFLRDAPANSSNAALYHAVLSECMRLAAENEDYTCLLDATDLLARAFEGYDRLAERRSLLKRMGSKRTAQAMLQLFDDPWNPAANEVVGRWFALTGNRWEDAVEMWRLAPPGPFQQAAQMDAERPTHPAERVQVGDAWYELAKRSNGKSEHLPLLSRALWWYQRAMPELAGVAKQQLSGRIEEIENEVPLDPQGFNWSTVTASQWDRLEGKIVTVVATEVRTDSGLTLKAGQRVRSVPHPTETWTHRDTFGGKAVVVVCTWVGGQSSYGFPGGPNGGHIFHPAAMLLCWQDMVEVPANGEVKGPGKIAFGPAVYPHQLVDGAGSLRVKLVQLEDE